MALLLLLLLLLLISAMVLLRCLLAVVAASALWVDDGLITEDFRWVRVVAFPCCRGMTSSGVGRPSHATSYRFYA
jgi:hypothetical protein